MVCAKKLDDGQDVSKEAGTVGVVCPSCEGDDGVPVTAVIFPPKLDCLDDQIGSPSDAVDAVGKEETEVAEVVERGPGVTRGVEFAVVPGLGLASTVNAVVNATMVKKPGASETVWLRVTVETTVVKPTTGDVGDARPGSFDGIEKPPPVETPTWYPPELDGQAVLLMMTTAGTPDGWPSVRVNLAGEVVLERVVVCVTVRTLGELADGGESNEETVTRGELDE